VPERERHPKPWWCPALLWRIREESRGTARWGPRPDHPEDEIRPGHFVEATLSGGFIGLLFVTAVGIIYFVFNLRRKRRQA